MKLVGILLLIVAGLFACHVVVDGKKLDRSYLEASSLIQHNVPEAMEKFEPSWKISSLRTFGKASKLRKQFTKELIDSALSRLESPSFTGKDGSNVVAVMGAIKNSPILKEEQKRQEQSKILDAIDRERINLAKNGMSYDFEAYAGMTRKLTQDAGLMLDFADRCKKLDTEAQKVDRYPIALRTAKTRATNYLLGGLRHLGLDGSRGSYAVIPMNASTGSWQPGDAEKSFRMAITTVDDFAKNPEWAKRGVPVELHRLAALAAHNAAMTRVAFTVLTARGGGQWQMYWVPPIPKLTTMDASIHRSNFKMDMNNLIADAIKRGKAIINKDPRGKEIARSALYAKAIVEARISKNTITASKAMQEYRTISPNDAISGPPASWPPKLVFLF